jgi:hypothetical protein
VGHRTSDGDPSDQSESFSRLDPDLPSLKDY